MTLEMKRTANTPTSVHMRATVVRRHPSSGRSLSLLFLVTMEDAMIHLCGVVA